VDVRDDRVELFLEGAEAVVRALDDASVAAAWDRSSVLEDQQVSGLAGHLARGAVWVVGDYLDAGPPDGPADFDTAAEYFAAMVSAASEEDNRAIRQRGADVGAVGRDELLHTVRRRLDALRPRLRALAPNQLLAVAGGNVMRLDEYLTTRIVEQVVHLDDLARSVERDPWPLPDAAHDLAIAVGVDVGRRRSGDTAMIRALYRRGFADACLPVL
jgi:Mycothiol maleylpyruvate isomerase N-terminal domain